MTRLITICSILAIVLAITSVAYCGTISGTVTNGSGSGISGLTVQVYEYPPEDDDELTSVLTNSSGIYTIPDLPAGQYMVAAFPGLTSLPYINEIYNDTMFYLEATPVTVTTSGTTSGIDFQLAASGMITGTVTNAATGDPIVGIWVLADNYDDEEGMFSDALTDAQGVYRMTGLPPGDYRLETDCEDTGLNYSQLFYNNKTSWNLADRVTLTGTQTTSGINFVLSPGGTVSGTVLDDQGQPIEGIAIQASAYVGEGWFGEAETQADGTYTLVGLASGTYKIRACPSCWDEVLPYADEYYDDADWKDASPVTVVVGETTPGIDFVLAGGTSISGFVFGWDAGLNDYVPVAGAELSAENLTTGSWSGWAQTEADGSYTMNGLTAGSYRVRASADTYSQEFYPNSIDWGGAVAVEVTVDEPATAINFDLDLGGQIEGTILDQDTGLPVTVGVWINAQPATGEPWGSGTNQIENDGSFTITGLPSGTYKLSVNATGYDQEFYDNTNDWMMADLVSVAVGQTTSGINLTPKREVGGTIIGQVVLPDGTPVSNANVNGGAMENMRWKWDNSEPNGFFTLTGITTGQWRVRVQPPFGQDYINYSETDEMIVTMPEGATEVNVGTIELPMVNIVGLVKLPDGNVATNSPVNIEKTDNSFFSHAQTDQSGHFRKGGLDAGEYRIRLEIPWGTSGIIRPDPCVIVITDPNVVLDVGTLTYATAAKHITGNVQLLGGEPVGGVQVNCWKRGSDGWANTQTNEFGAFTLDVAPGTWEVMIHPSPQQQEQGAEWVYTGMPEVVVFASDSSEETKTVTFAVQSAFSRITGRVIGPAGEILRQGAGWIDIKSDSGKGNGSPIGAGGEFNVAVTAGTYNVWVGVDLRTYPYWTSPRLNPVTVNDDQTVNLGDIQLVTKNSGIQGQVTRSSDGSPIAGVRVNAWQRQGGWADATTDDLGNYRLSLLAGTWDVVAEAPYTSDYISGQPPRSIVVADNQIVVGVNFQLQQAGGSVEISLFDSGGALLTDIDNGWAYAREGQFSMQPVAGSPVSNGQATIKLPAGTYIIGVFLPPNSGYTLSGEQEVTLADSEVELSMTLMSNNSVIMGTFYTDAEKTSPATGLLGEVFAMQKMGGVWQSAPINSTDGSFQLRVAAGEWNLGYWIRSAGYINNPPPDSKVILSSGETETFDFVLMGADATITGQILDPNGNPMNHAWVWAHSEGDGTPGSMINNGSQAQEPDATFTINVPSGRQYEVGSNAPAEWGYIQPDFETVTPTTGQTVTVNLQYKQSDASISGNVFYVDDTDNEVLCEYAWVNAWSDNGQHTSTGTDEDGLFQLNVASGTIWHLEAMYRPREEQTFFKSQIPVNVTVSSSSNTANIEVIQASRELPSAVSAVFDPNVGWNSTLEDGTRIEIPGGAIPADDNVAISFTPMVDELERTATDKPVGWGYAISISEQATGNQISDNFNTNVLITFAYLDADLAEEGLTEDDISPAYYSTTTSSWTKVESFTVDKDNNTITVQVNHFSTWALTGGAAIESDDEETQEIAMTIAKCAVKAGVTQGLDSITASGTFAQTTSDFNGITAIDVNIISLTDDEMIYEESVAFSAAQVINGKFKYTHKLVSGAPGAITALTIDFTKKTFSIKTKNTDLTGLGCPLQLNITLGSYALSGDANEAIVNRANKRIPIRLMRTYLDELRIKSAKAKTNVTPLAESFTVKGELAVEAVADTNLVNEDVTLTWGEQTFVIPAGSMVSTSAVRKAYKCSNIALDEGGIANGKFDLDKCTFNITIKNATLAVTSGAVNFAMSFNEFSEDADLNLP